MFGKRLASWRRRIAALLVVLAATLGAAPGGAQEPQQLPFEPLIIETKSGAQEISVEVARTDEERAIGLMHRTELPLDQGMLFDFGTDRVVNMWMRNTLISLDMLFITRDGQIIRIAENTTPLSERIVTSGRPVRSVLELVAGSAKRRGIQPGDRVRHALFGNDGP